MKRYFFIILIPTIILFCPLKSDAQISTISSSPWQTEFILAENVTFNVPTSPLILDTLNTQMYSVSVDSLLGLNVHILDSAQFQANDSLVAAALQQQNNDTLRAIASLALLTTNSELTEIENIQNGN